MTINQAKKSHSPVKEDAEEAAPHYLDETYAEATLGSTYGLGSEEQKILGVRREPDGDQLVLDVANMAQLASTLEPTKRNIVSTIWYDTLGFLAPLIIKFKVLFQKLCEIKVNWDQTLAGELVHEWRILVSELQENQPISLPRSYFTCIDGDITSYHLCGFCDASTRAYAAVVYLILKTEEDTFVRFVAAKTRVAPLQAQTIPRLEFLSVLLLSPLCQIASSPLSHWQKWDVSLTPRSRCFGYVGQTRSGSLLSTTEWQRSDDWYLRIVGTTVQARLTQLTYSREAWRCLSCRWIDCGTMDQNGLAQVSLRRKNQLSDHARGKRCRNEGHRPTCSQSTSP